MRKAISLVSALILLALIFNILRSNPPDTTTVPEVDIAPGSTQARTSTDGSQPVSTPPTAETQAVTDGTVAGDTRSDAELEARLVIDEVAFGENGYVALRNVGGAIGNLEGYVICQRPGYFELPSVEIEPFGVVWIAVDDGAGLTSTAADAVVAANGAFGGLDPASGEMALYVGSAFDDPAAIRSYVEWGEAGHGRSAVAIAAGLWETETFIEIPDDTFGVSATAAAPSGPGDWVATIGG